MRIYEIYGHEGAGIIQWPVHIAYFENPDTAERYRKMLEEQHGTSFVVQEIGLMDKSARRELRAWEKSRVHTEAG